MRALDILPPHTDLGETALPKENIELRISSLERQINSHLVMLLALDASGELRSHWKGEVQDWFEDISVLRIKPKTTHPPVAMFWTRLYDGPFGGVEEGNVRSILRRTAAKGIARNGLTDAQVADRLKSFYEAATPKLTAGDPCTGLIAGL